MTKAVRLKDIAWINRQVLPESTPDNFAFKYVDIGSVADGTVMLPDQATTFESAPSRARRLASPGDVLVSTVRTYLRAIAPAPTADTRLVYSTGFAVVKAMPGVDSRWLVYACMSDSFVGEVQARSVGVSYPAINPADLGSIEIQVPALPNQRRIADFLDAETSRLDQLIAARRSMSIVARQRFESQLSFRLQRTSVWSDTSSAWPKLPLRRVVSKIKTGSTPPEASYTDGVHGTLPWYGPGSFGEGPELGEPVRMLDPRLPGAATLPHDSTLIIGIGATAGKVAHLKVPASANQQITAIRAHVGMRPSFLTWQLWSCRDEMRALAPFTTLPIINNDFLRSFPVIVPDLEMQDRIVAEADQSWAWLEKLQSATVRSVGLLAERRRALITAAVTGAIDVTTARV